MKYISFYFPQFHTIPENDLWWGKGFTDWVNVRKAKPRFAGHYQPHIPHELGYYDLRDPIIREKQAKLAKAYGIDGFCYYHYWFNGKRLLGEPLDGVIKSKKPEFPFCLCWANENWTRAWDGREKKVLISQRYTTEDNEEHINWLLTVFSDPRYIRIEGKPLFLIYRPSHVQEVDKLINMWQNRAISAGFPGIHICSVRSNFPQQDAKKLNKIGFDAMVDFQPNFRNVSDPTLALVYRVIRRSLFTWLGKHFEGSFKRKMLIYSSRQISYPKLVEGALKELSQGPLMYPCVFPSWDNSSRKTRAHIIQNTEPELYGKWLAEATLYSRNKLPPEQQIIFINAWNEWAEGCHLEPDVRFKRSFLETTLRVKREFEPAPKDENGCEYF